MKNKEFERRTWDEFRDNKFIWLVNSFLHVFGWAIAVDIKDGKVADVYPARVKFRGFSQKSNDLGYKRITEYMRDNADELCEDLIEDDDTFN